MSETEEGDATPLVALALTGFSQLDLADEGLRQGLARVAKAGRYRGLRRVVGDGNCFYRATAFRMVELLVTEKLETERSRLLEFFRNSPSYLAAVGYTGIGVETFQEMVVETFEADLPRLTSTDEVVALFARSSSSEHLVWFLRLLSAAEMRHHPERYLPYLPEPYAMNTTGDVAETLATYCAREVEPSYKEVEQPQIIALCECLGITVEIEYISSKSRVGDDEDANRLTFGVGQESNTTTHPLHIRLLYRPGHYDVLV